MPTTPFPLPPPPPPPAPTVPHLTRPNVASEGPPGALRLELLIHNGYPFKDHWAFRVRSRGNNDIGVVFHATGDVRNGFVFEIKRNFEFRRDLPIPSQIIPLQWIDKENFDEGLMFVGDNGVAKFDYEPLETSAFEQFCGSAIQHLGTVRLGSWSLPANLSRTVFLNKKSRTTFVSSSNNGQQALESWKTMPVNYDNTNIQYLRVSREGCAFFATAQPYNFVILGNSDVVI